MSSLPSPSEVAGFHISQYETYYNLVDPKNIGYIQAMDAAKFLKKSFLSDDILSKIWDIADPASCGSLDKCGMFVALKLCALAQQGYNLHISNIYKDIPPPKMGDTSDSMKMIFSSQSTTSTSAWSIDPLERFKYEQLFHSLEPVNGCVPGNKVKGLLLDSKLPLKTLGKIWDLADIDKDGQLNQHEFIIAMHLVYKALENYAIPSELPRELIDDSTNKIPVSSKLQETVNYINESGFTSSVSSNESKTDDWIVSLGDQKTADNLFIQADQDLDGFVSGSEIKDVFIKSGLSKIILADIWSLCDISRTGKLNKEQFALSLWLINKKLSGMELPTKLSAEMIPPSFRMKSSEFVENSGKCSYSNPELDIINQDIIEIINEKHTIEQNISQKEADIKVKNGEIKSLQSELDTLAATLRQLDNQKGEAQKRLNDLKSQIDKLREKASVQESTLRSYEDDLNSRRLEIEGLKLAEQNLELQQQEYKNHLLSLSKNLQNIQLQISQTKANITHLEEQQRQIIDTITYFDAALAIGDVSVISDSSLIFTAKINRSILHNSKYEKVIGNDNEDSKKHKSFAAFINTDSYNELNCDPFQEDFHPGTDNIEDPFGEDPFAALHAPVRSESPSPALPPKKSKQPPPRPAPPRPTQGPQSLVRASIPIATTSPGSSDPFAEKLVLENSDSSNTVDFADFANFDTKISMEI